MADSQRNPLEVDEWWRLDETEVTMLRGVAWCYGPLQVDTSAVGEHVMIAAGNPDEQPTVVFINAVLPPEVRHRLATGEEWVFYVGKRLRASDTRYAEV
jgi:hypothetical protein